MEDVYGALGEERKDKLIRKILVNAIGRYTFPNEEWTSTLVAEVANSVKSGTIGLGWAMDDISIVFLVDDITYRLETEGSHLLITEGNGHTGIVQPSILLVHLWLRYKQRHHGMQIS